MPSRNQRTITARYASQCRNCGEPIEPGDRILWNPKNRSATRHADCGRLRVPDPPPGPSPSMWRHYADWMTPEQLEIARDAYAKQISPTTYGQTPATHGSGGRQSGPTQIGAEGGPEGGGDAGGG